jgi:hypothetical protein
MECRLCPSQGYYSWIRERQNDRRLGHDFEGQRQCQSTSLRHSSLGEVRVQLVKHLQGKPGLYRRPSAGEQAQSAIQRDDQSYCHATVGELPFKSCYLQACVELIGHRC